MIQKNAEISAFQKSYRYTVLFTSRFPCVMLKKTKWHGLQGKEFYLWYPSIKRNALAAVCV